VALRLKTLRDRLVTKQRSRQRRSEEKLQVRPRELLEQPQLPLLPPQANQLLPKKRRRTSPMATWTLLLSNLLRRPSSIALPM